MTRAVIYGKAVNRNPGTSRPRRFGLIVPLAAAGALALSACASSVSNGTPINAPTTITNGTSLPATNTSPSLPAPVAKKHVPVHVSVNIADGATVGVGMPVIASFNAKITDGRAFEGATKVSVNGAPVDARWYFEYSDPASGHVMEAHLRMQHYWPAHAQIHIDLPVKNRTGGSVAHHPNSEYVFDDSLTSDFAIGDAHVVTVSNATHTVTITDDGRQWGGTFPTSLGANDTPTKRGIKVIMEKGRDISMRGPGYFDPHIKYTQRLTYDGEYLHSAPWNTYNIDHGINSSNGCTNLHPADALKLYNFLGVGDVVQYSDATGPKMQLGDGYGDWNVTWGLWMTGGAISTE
jgi:lipoprotein-anchoring transpeptidase ErfK/SrfK